MPSWLHTSGTLAFSCCLLALAAGSGQVRDLDGRAFDPFHSAERASVLFFVTSDCPISNAYAPEIQRLCGVYQPRGIACLLVYEDPAIDIAAVRKHLAEYRYAGVRAAIDTGDIARHARATITPEAVVVDSGGTIRYRGRIDDLYVDVGKRRRVVTVHDLQESVEAVLAGRRVAAAETTAFGCNIVARDSSRKQP